MSSDDEDKAMSNDVKERAPPPPPPHVEATSDFVRCTDPNSGVRYEWRSNQFYPERNDRHTYDIFSGGRGAETGCFCRSALADALVASDELICALFFTFTLRLKGVLGEGML